MAFARGKIILFGEHAVVYGRPALATGIARGARAEARQASSDRLRVAPWNVTIAPSNDDSNALARAFANVLALYPNRPSHVEVDAHVDVPAGAGLGSSAALGVAVIEALDEWAGIRRTAEERAETSLVWERVFHGSPSGIDAMMASVGGFGVFRRGQPLERFEARSAVPLVVGFSGESSSTKAMVEQVARQLDRSPEQVNKVFDGIASLVQNARLSLEAGDLPHVGKLMDLNQALLNSLMLSTAKLEEMCAAARNAGALGAKLTGSGGGGCMIALAPHDAAARDIERALEEHSDVVFTAEAGR